MESALVHEPGLKTNSVYVDEDQKYNLLGYGERNQHLTKFMGKKRWTHSGKYTGSLRYNLTPEQEKEILYLRHGPDLDLEGKPRLALHNIAQQVGVNANYVSRFLRKYFKDHDVQWQKKNWWKKGYHIYARPAQTTAALTGDQGQTVGKQQSFSCGEARTIQYETAMNMYYTSYERSLRRATQGMTPRQLDGLGETTRKASKLMLCHPDQLSGYLCRMLPFVNHRKENRNKNGLHKQIIHQQRKEEAVLKYRYLKRKENMERYQGLKELYDKGEIGEELLRRNRLYLAEKRGLDINTCEAEDLVRHWSLEENLLWIKLTKQHGRNYKKISQLMGTRNMHACTTKAHNTYVRMLTKGKMPLRSIPYDQELFDILKAEAKTRSKYDVSSRAKADADDIKVDLIISSEKPTKKVVRECTTDGRLFNILRMPRQHPDYLRIRHLTKLRAEKRY